MMSPCIPREENCNTTVSHDTSQETNPRETHARIGYFLNGVAVLPAGTFVTACNEYPSRAKTDVFAIAGYLVVIRLKIVCTLRKEVVLWRLR